MESRTSGRWLTTYRRFVGSLDTAQKSSTSRSGSIGLRRATLVNRVRDRLFVSSVARKINSDLANVLTKEKFDLLLVMKGVHLFPETIAAAKTRVAHVVNWNPDDFFNPLNSSRSLLASFPLYDCIFTPRRHLVGEYLDRGAKRVEALDWYYLPKLHYPVTVSDEEKQRLGSDVVFIGTWSPRREALLGALAGFDVRIWGAYWERASANFPKGDRLPPSRVRRGHVQSDSLVEDKHKYSYRREP